jgi:Ca2+-transporting ATPase
MAGIKIPRTEGEAFMKLNEVEMLKAIHNTTLLTRMFPSKAGRCYLKER